MTKEEVINKIIDMRKDGIERPFNDYCLSINPCECCPFHNDDCPQAMISELIDRLIKAEERPETNLEHYILDKRVDVHFRNKDEAWHLIFKVGTDDACYESRNRFNAIEWLLSPYEEPKPKYKLSKFEYDLLEYHSGSKFGFKDFWILEHMQDKGYFKDIPNDVPIRDILDNCEVIDE